MAAFTTVVAERAGDDGLDRARRLNDANRAVHDRIVVMARHPRLAAMLGRTVDIPLVFRAFQLFGTDELERSDLFHRLILDAIGQHDAVRAGQLMAEHIRQGLQTVLDGIPPGA